MREDFLIDATNLKQFHVICYIHDITDVLYFIQQLNENLLRLLERVEVYE